MAHTGRICARALKKHSAHAGGFCGELSRTFVVIAQSLGIPAQRLYLFGSFPHVVTEVELNPGEIVIVDAVHSPKITELEPLQGVMLRSDFDDYATVNLDRLHLRGVGARFRLKISLFTGWYGEAPSSEMLALAFPAGIMVFLHVRRHRI